VLDKAGAELGRRIVTGHDADGHSMIAGDAAPQRRPHLYEIWNTRIVVQRGTNHAWANRGKGVCRMAFILIDGVFEDGLADTAGREQPS
jgi:hypothetical protein